jgi:uncharacterized SAM-binding protein YcdF (DUF218 family)
MFFVLKKILALLVMPLSVGLLLMLLAIIFLYRENLKMSRLFMLVAFAWIALLSFTPFSELLMKPLESQYPALTEFPADIRYVVVLGSGHTSNDRLPQSSQLSNPAMFRLAEGISILRQLEDAKLVVSGYAGGDPTPHALMLKRMAEQLGVDESRIIARYAPRDTREEARDLKPILGGEDFILVTSASHMPRAMAAFHEQGLYPHAAPTYHLVKEPQEWLVVPDAGGLHVSERAIHEYVGRLWLQLLALVQDNS